MQEVTREIQIDAGHRIPNHSSKCRNLHGHRYIIQATIQGNLCTTQGDSSEGMVLDFGFIKELMMIWIHEFHDHLLILWRHDKALPKKLATDCVVYFDKEFGSFIMNDEILGRLLITNFIPTAENLAAYWFHLLNSKLGNKTVFKLTKVRVYETPNCWADYNLEVERIPEND